MDLASFTVPTRDELEKYAIIVSTLASAHLLIHAELEASDFTYVV
jgi:hypothetical protein